MRAPSLVRSSGGLVLAFSCACVGPRSNGSPAPAAPVPDRPSGAEDDPMPRLGEPGEDYETPLAGRGFRTELFGHPVQVPPRDRRSITAWDLGFVFQPELEGAEFGTYLPFGALYFWRNPDVDHLLRATVIGVFDDVFYAHSPEGFGPFEWIVTLQNFTPPVAQAEFVDGVRNSREELVWGDGRVGLGLGWRDRGSPGFQENMREVSLSIEPGWFHADESADSASEFVEPASTFELRGHLRARWDALERNILELAHEGVAVGVDVVAGLREDWRDWGLNAQENGDDAREWARMTGYVKAAGGLPWTADERHRLIGSIYAGFGEGLDRFSAVRIGGGPTGDEYGAIARPVLPGALVREYFPDNYALVSAEYRFEPLFFTYVGFHATAAWLDRDRLESGLIKRRDDLIGSFGVRLTTGFVGDLRLQVEYAWGDSVYRSRSQGGHSFVMHISRSF